MRNYIYLVLSKRGQGAIQFNLMWFRNTLDNTAKLSSAEKALIKIFNSQELEVSFEERVHIEAVRQYPGAPIPTVTLFHLVSTEIELV